MESVENIIENKFSRCERHEKALFDTYEELADTSRDHLKIGFIFKSLMNLSNSGLVSPYFARIANTEGVRMVGMFSDWGKIQPTNKCQGEKKSVDAAFENMLSDGYSGGAVTIDHCDGFNLASLFKEKILSVFPTADVRIKNATGRSSYYTERGGIIFCYEK